ncbi:hypothetical protein SCUCBS95973_002544 [Sporothrix curviconia]|uniref:Uncharacterized protein n=1 Tax=Sporothrix curviconia TaxID=1260050 RepID=A0ABP0B7S1_9PEZI
MYAMERDSRRDRGQWRGCHTFNNIICDGDSSQSQTPRSGGLKMGHTYYYYYEVDGSLETHDPAVPSTAACPYLPGQRVNTLWVPIEQPPSFSSSSSSPSLLAPRQRSASVNAVRRCDYRTMDPADRFLTPRPPPATPSAAPTTTTAAETAEQRRLLSPQTHLLRHQRSARSLSPAVASPSTWSPRRFFARRASPSHERTRPIMMTTADEHSEEVEFLSSSVDSRSDGHCPAIPRLVSSSSASSFASFSSLGRRRQATLTPAVAATAASSQGSRSRDISPESLRRFLVDDVPLPVSCDNSNSSVAESSRAFLLAESDNEDDGAVVVAAAAVVTGKNDLHDSIGDDNDDDDDDEHNFATSTTSETAPMTILSPPPPPQSRAITPPKVDDAVVEVQQQQDTPAALTVVQDTLPLALPEAPTRAPPAIPVPTAPESVETPASEVADTTTTISTPQLDIPSLSSQLPPQLSLSLELPVMLNPPSPISFSPLSLSSVSGDWKPSSSRAASTTDDEDEDDEDDTPTAAPREPIALYLPSLEPLSQDSAEDSKAASQQNHRHHHHHLVAAALAGSTATLVPGSGSGLDDLMDELGWMATAIQD